MTQRIQRILIVSYYYWPEQNPRSFRAYELAREFARRGCPVTVVTKTIGDEREDHEGVSIIEIPVPAGPGSHLSPGPSPGGPGEGRHGEGRPASPAARIRSRALSRLAPLWKLFFWPAFWQCRFAHRGAGKRKDPLLRGPFDLTISSAMPMASHLLTRRLKRRGIRLGVIVADYGDPFTFNPNTDFSRINYYKERRLASMFDYVSTPTPKAHEAFINIGVDRRRLLVIPHGGRHILPEEIRCRLPEPVGRGPVLVYGGAFIEKIRNPENFFEALLLLADRGVRPSVYIYTSLADPYVHRLRETYEQRLGGRLFFNNLVRRDHLRDLMRQADYCLNFRNRSRYQEPSKLFDYALVGARTIDIAMEMTPEAIADKIQTGDAYTPPLAPETDIRRIADAFLNLAKPSDGYHGERPSWPTIEQ